MPTESAQLYYDDEIELRKLIKTLLKGWKIILGLMVIGGVGAWGYSQLQSPVYEASAKVLIDDTFLPVSAATFLTSEDVRAETASVLEISTAELIVPHIATVLNDDQVLMVSVQAASAMQAASLANTWTEAAIVVVQARAEAELAKAEAELAKAEAELIDYLEQEGLLAWGWADLAAFTGVGWESGSSTQPEFQALPAISAVQRLRLLELMRAQRSAEHKASGVIMREVEEALQSNSQDIGDAASLIQAAEVPTNPTGVDVLVNTAVGLTAGGMLGMFWVFVVAWWREDSTSHKIEDE